MEFAQNAVMEDAKLQKRIQPIVQKTVALIVETACVMARKRSAVAPWIVAVHRFAATEPVIAQA